jgi:hypothetical protein
MRSPRKRLALPAGIDAIRFLFSGPCISIRVLCRLLFARQSHQIGNVVLLDG